MGFATEKRFQAACREDLTEVVFLVEQENADLNYTDMYGMKALLP
jgi:hypothetical protein